MPGGLAVGYYFGGLSIFKPGSVTHYVAGRDFPRGSVKDIDIGKDHGKALATKADFTAEVGAILAGA